MRQTHTSWVDKKAAMRVLLGVIVAGWTALASAKTVTRITLTDKACAALVGVKPETVRLVGGDKPFRCERAGGKTFDCVSSRSGRTLALEMTEEGDAKVVLESASPHVLIQIDVKAKTFQVASLRANAQAGVTSEVCTGTADVE